ncbi:TolC family outer membrane protein [Methylocystis sp. MJC1]|jgi:outer membrane protein|uniref:TolC family outer membrane protein n=1 Tax=Methylocystis sp. MJC1 TaxID=2654282 RepID=UPI0013EB35E0|nr:TolC family outer membrane protein [Methylocystis sp. MJC1]KAF2991696.1 Outer membrane efflux protein BepC [Methylocystis sp. MJC1]MBU6527066.1 TolC family outer membrane protein [Methylocystis sp. MJC1]UZX13503.1 TolC family outer membrane protein [Methylocystis sp. MJC1]
MNLASKRSLGQGLAPVAHIALIAAALVTASISDAQAESLLSALARAYAGNPDLNQSRANVRVRDEDTPKAAAGMRPKASIQASAGPQYGNLRIPGGRNQTTGQRQFFGDEFVGWPRGATLNITQSVFDGGRTANSMRQAESGVFAARATMRLTEQAILQNGATAYMNVLRDTAVVNLRKNNISVLEQQLKQTRDRFDVGEVTRTDVAQAEASLAQARSDLYAAQAQLKTSIANYHQLIGNDPSHLEPGRSLEPLLPRSLNEAIGVALAEHPGVVAALHQVDAAELAVKVAESALSPTLSVNAQVSNQYDSFLGFPGSRQFSASAIGQLNVPLYQGGAEYASIRQAKEQLGQARLNADLQRDSVRASVVSSYGLLETAKASIVSQQAAVKAAETALAGVREEAKVGQRTTLDVLNAQQALLNARVGLVIAQRDRVVASFAALGSIGRLSAQELNLDVTLYDPGVHYEQVKLKWIGTETPDGR